MYQKEHKSVEDLIQIFKDRGMMFNNIDKARERLANINYYKIKEFAKPYYKLNSNNEYQYQKIAFEHVLIRFYQDKNLRIHLLHAIEKVEISFKTKLAFILGKKHEAFGYLDFKNWVNKTKFCKYYISDKEKEFKKLIKTLLERKENSIIEEFLQENPDCEYPPIWMVIEILTFGDVLKLYGLMSEKNREEIARYYDSTDYELENWLKTLKLIRNFSAHNINVIDCKITTKPIIRKNWEQYLFTFNDKNNIKNVTNKIAVVIIILMYLIKKINPDYGFGNFRDVFEKLFRNNDVVANQYGFYNKDLKIFSKNFKL